MNNIPLEIITAATLFGLSALLCIGGLLSELLAGVSHKIRDMITTLLVFSMGMAQLLTIIGVVRYLLSQ